MRRKPCAGCGKRTQVLHPILPVHCCRECQQQGEYATITSYKAIGEFGITPIDLLCLRHRPGNNGACRFYRLPVPLGVDSQQWEREPAFQLCLTGMKSDNLYLRRHVEAICATV
jgi:hypothetical protein